MSRRMSVRITEVPIIEREESEDVMVAVKDLAIRPYTNRIFLATLDECIDELNILQSMFKQSDIEKQVVIYETLEERYGLNAKRQEKRGKFIINDVYSDSQKLQKEIALINDILGDASEELLAHGTKWYLNTAVYSLQKMAEDDQNLLESEKKNRKLIKGLKNQWTKFKQDIKHSMEDVENLLAFMKTQWDITTAYLNEEIKYVEKWENSRAQQLYHVLKKKEGDYKKTIEDTEEKITNERRCHSQIVKFIQYCQEDYQRQTEEWMERYDIEIEEKDSEILKLKIKHQQLIEDHKLLQITHERRVREMQDWMEYKWNKAVEMWQLKIKEKAAVKIQAWWRETMKRRFLGPYRKKKGKKGKGKKGEKAAKGGKKKPKR